MPGVSGTDNVDKVDRVDPVDKGRGRCRFPCAQAPAMPDAKNGTGSHNVSPPFVPPQKPVWPPFQKVGPGRAAGGKGTRKETHAVRLYTLITPPKTPSARMGTCFSLCSPCLRGEFG
ncbi:hypothetical protein JCM14469_35470 [Desulfatiferula olefinivorans]